MKRRILNLALVLILFIPTMLFAKSPPIIIPSEIQETKVNFSWYGNEAQFLKKYAVHTFGETGEGIVCGVALVEQTVEKEVWFFIRVTYLRLDNQYFPAMYLYDGHEFLLYNGSINKNRHHLFEAEGYQWIWYMRNGFNGFMYIKENDLKVKIKIPAHVFKQIDSKYELWKQE